MLNKGDEARKMRVDRYLPAGQWQDMQSGETLQISADNPVLAAQVPAHGLRAFRFGGAVTDSALKAIMARQMLALHGEQE